MVCFSYLKVHKCRHHGDIHVRFCNAGVSNIHPTHPHGAPHCRSFTNNKILCGACFLDGKLEEIPISAADAASPQDLQGLIRRADALKETIGTDLLALVDVNDKYQIPLLDAYVALLTIEGQLSRPEYVGESSNTGLTPEAYARRIFVLQLRNVIDAIKISSDFGRVFNRLSQLIEWKDTLPVFDHQQLPTEDRFCPICTSPYSNSSQGHEYAVQTPCNHLYCIGCIGKWLDESEGSCPHCRNVIPKVEDPCGFAEINAVANRLETPSWLIYLWGPDPDPKFGVPPLDKPDGSDSGDSGSDDSGNENNP